MQILVTGGAGFIGGHLAERFAGDGHDVVALDSFVPYYDLGIKERNVEQGQIAADESGGSYELVRGDIRDEDVVEEQVADADVVFHQAAQAGVRTSVDQPKTVNEINVDGTLNVLEAARNSETERVVVASSSSVYGKPQYLPYDEEHPTTPISPYGASKLAEEQYARVYNEVYGLPTVSLRYFTVYGPRMRPNMAISNFVSRCLNGESPVIYGDGTQTRDFTYIDDVVRANEALLNTSAADGEVINIGSTDNISIQTLAEEIRDHLAPELELEYTDRHDADAEHTHANIEKANELFGYEPSTSIREGVERFTDWYKVNRNWYEPLVRNS
ncbi:NAD-dependent epimerase/dehydratase family protein [Halogranum rubrum]|uniref:Nucleoside-diphosphate-sugar epimerase 1 (UDP-glucose 4-epimerase) n=1 Tax=Halogranum salarium B-1 TaxID=1210908 RepID=J2ZY10_9EURY|nr:NAD-dependent epimerase/dehydratase family protein [Halogranum salarium]EJN57913.1 nucleoside-diphosphate-sugar epimerase 1 (UDP-glucose 4-epimerase) [Halogranum salarium B-1]